MKAVHLSTSLRAALVGSLAVVLTPSGSGACACCGIDGTWLQLETEMSEGTGALLEELDFGSGAFDDAPAYEVLAEIENAEFRDRRLRWSTVDGDFTLRLEGRAEHRRVDVTFLTDPGSKLTDEATIYHELVAGGTLSLPEPFLARYPSGSLPGEIGARLIVQGVGTMCVGEETFRRWLLKPEDRELRFAGSGTLVSESSVASPSGSEATRSQGHPP